MTIKKAHALLIGKTTLLRILGGILQLTAGSIQYEPEKTFIFLLISSVGGFRKTKGVGICVMILVFIALLKTDSWFSQNAWLVYIVALLLLAGATIYLAEYKYE